MEKNFDINNDVNTEKSDNTTKSNITSVSVAEIEPFYKQKTPRMWGLMQKNNILV